jgi:proteasome lid subunit RPN8/RPN11
MSLLLTQELLGQIQAHCEASYPEEGAGFLLGKDGEPREVLRILKLTNQREDGSRRNRYLISPRDYIQAEMEAEKLGLTLLGVFHSHPDHPDEPSNYDREWAQPWFSYTITRVDHGHSQSSRCWRLLENRVGFVEESMMISS